MLGASLLLAFREIRRHLLRSVLTVLGIVIGVAAVITMVTVGNGVTASVRTQIASLGANTLMVVPNQSGRQAGSAAPRPFETDDIQAIGAQIAGIQAVSGQASSNVTATAEGVNWQTSITGTTNAGIGIQAMSITSGRMFTPEEESAGKSVCIIGTTVRKNLFPTNEPVGQELRVGKLACPIIGVLKERGQGGMGNDQDDVVLMPLRTVQRQIIGNTDIYWIVIGVDPAYDNKTVSADLDKLLRERRHLAPDQNADFRLIDMKQISDTVSGTLKVMTGLVAAIASISLIVGGIGIVNIMLVSVTERTREIGIRLAIGALAREVRLQFLTEAVVLCSLGGAIGIALSFGLSMLLTKIMAVDFVFDPLINLGSLLFSSFLGIVFGYVPAQRAAALNPIDALRHE
ncbi:ABC transporter permease [Sphingomonas crusticola]|uniref:ABC transporter permease n=1 Tax=Sphingomonas crusticola TaxID=1697973 RepID=UPI000E22A2A2|nr:ABC transporter permease [Sphingomonas crusticola]